MRTITTNIRPWQFESPLVRTEGFTETYCSKINVKTLKAAKKIENQLMPIRETNIKEFKNSKLA